MCTKDNRITPIASRLIFFLHALHLHRFVPIDETDAMTASEKLNAEVESFVKTAWTRTEAYLIYSGISPSRFGKTTANDPNLIHDIRKGKRKLTFQMAQKVSAYLDSTVEIITQKSVH